MVRNGMEENRIASSVSDKCMKYVSRSTPVKCVQPTTCSSYILYLWVQIYDTIVEEQRKAKVNVAHNVERIARLGRLRLSLRRLLVRFCQDTGVFSTKRLLEGLKFTQEVPPYARGTFGVVCRVDQGGGTVLASKSFHVYERRTKYETDVTDTAKKVSISR